MRTNPGEDTPRLMFADWLMEHHPRNQLGDLLRYGVEAAMSRPRWLLGERGWYTDETALDPLPATPSDDCFGRAWLALKTTWFGWPPLASDPGMAAGWRWHRGTPAHVVLDWPAWVRWWPLITSLGPVGRVTLTSAPLIDYYVGETLVGVAVLGHADGKPVLNQKRYVSRSVWEVANTSPGIDLRPRLLIGVAENAIREAWKGEVADFNIAASADHL